MQTVLFKSLSFKNSSEDERKKFLREVKETSLENYILLSTCNRVEFYYSAHVENVEEANRLLQATINHLASVGSGIESYFVGEQDIKFQLKTAYFDALEKGTTDRYLNLLFQHGMRISKLVRTKTDISKGAVSHSSVTVKIIDEHIKDISSKKIMFLGAHRMNTSIIKHLKKKGAEMIFMANRTYYKALHIAEELDCEVIKFTSVSKKLHDVDILITATSCPHELIKKSDVIDINRELLIIDLGFPADVQKEVDEIELVNRFDLKRVEEYISSETEKRSLNVSDAKAIIEKESKLFVEELRSQDERQERVRV